MSGFRRHVEQAFGTDIVETYLNVYPSPPRIRFELGVGDPKGRQYITEAEMRCNTLLDFLVRAGSDLWIELVFFDPTTEIRRPRTAMETLEVLRHEGLHPSDGDWEVNDVRDGATLIEQRYAARVGAGTDGLRTLAKIVVCSDHGLWDRHDCLAYFFSAAQGVLYHPYDDRGADVLAPTVEALRAWYNRFNNWILDFDRAWIDELFSKRH